MKVSIWQQFSSNHSANYMIVGVFDTANAAKDAGEKTLKIITEIREWNVTNDLDKLGWKLNPIEEKYAKEYNIEWKAPVDWLRAYPHERFYRYGAWRKLEENVIIQDNIVFVTSPMTYGDNTWQVGHQFDELFKAMGATTYSQTDYGTLPDDNHDSFFSIQMTILCKAPTNEIATMVADHINTPRSVAWVTYHPFYSRIIGDIQKRAHKSNSDVLENTSENAGSTIDDDEAKDEAMEFILMDLDLRHIMATVSGKNITITDYDSKGSCIFFSAFVRWAKDLGCELEYKFEQLRGYDDL